MSEKTRLAALCLLDSDLPQEVQLTAMELDIVRASANIGRDLETIASKQARFAVLIDRLVWKADLGLYVYTKQ